MFEPSLDSRYNSVTLLGSPDPRRIMTDVTRILNAIEQGDAKAADELLPLVYEEPKRIYCDLKRQITCWEIRQSKYRLIGLFNRSSMCLMSLVQT